MDNNTQLQINTSKSQTKQKVVDQLKLYISNQGFEIEEQNINKPWGAYFRLLRSDTKNFIQKYFNLDQKAIENLLQYNLDPKFLLVAPNKKLSWQYHFNRSEMWTVLVGPVKVITSNNDIEKNKRILQSGQNIKIPPTERHRLIGLENWGIVAEIWVHTNTNTPSNENDIVRVQDDFGRT